MKIHLEPDADTLAGSLTAGYVHSVLQPLCEHYRLPMDELLQKAGLPQLAEQPDTTLLPLLDVMRLFLVLLAHSHDPALGLEIGRLVKARSYQVLGYVILSSATLGEAIRRLISFERLVGNLGRSSMEYLDDRVRLYWACPLQGEPARYLTEAAITGWVAFARQLVDRPGAPLKVYFRHPRQADLARYEAFFECPVEFGAAFDGVELPLDMLDWPLASADAGLSQIMLREAQQLLADYDKDTNLRNMVSSHCYHLLLEGEPSVEAVAKRMGLAGRTLQSRLRKQGVSFQQLLDELRRSLADVYLRDPALNLMDIALLLGFSEQSAFTRAFRRWHGVSPAQYRQRRETG